VLLHQNAVGALATTVPLAERSPAEQERLLGQLVAVYPEFFACASYAADGSGIARSDGRPSVQADDIPLFATLQRTAAPALELRRSRTIERPIIAFGAPLLRDGSFSGAVICGLEVKRIAELAQQVALEGDRSVVVVDAADQLVATDMADIATFADLSSYPPVAALRAANNATGSQRYGEPPDERLTAYAQVPGLGWGVVVDRPLADDLSAVRGARELAFGLLLLAITLAALVGAFAARVFTRSLNALSSAVSRFAMGDAAAPLPREGMSEVRRLSAAFDQMRLDLTAAAKGREQAITQRDSFFSVAAHELKTPLTALLGQAQLFQRRARREGQLNEKDQRSLDVVVAQALRLNNLITDLLDVSRLQHGRLTPELELLDLRALVARVVDEFRPTVEPRIIVATGLDGPLTPVSGDAMRLEQVLHNLLSNAVKYSPAGGDVFVSLALSGGEAHIAVRDQGIGIPADALPQLFERFFRAANAEPRRIGGMGVGLFVVHEIVALHHGRVEVASVEGQGSTFTVVLPLAEV
jgi:signal transduction histidine kinase